MWKKQRNFFKLRLVYFLFGYCSKGKGCSFFKSAFGGRFQLTRRPQAIALPSLKKAILQNGIQVFLRFGNLLVDFGVRNCLFFFFSMFL